LENSLFRSGRSLRLGLALGLPVLTELIQNLSGFPGNRHAGHILERHPSGVGGIVPGHQVSSPVFSQNIDDDVMK